MLKGLARLSPAVWVTGERVFSQVFWLAVFVVQAKMLGPYAFGLVSIVMAFIGFWEGVPGIAMTDALISIRDIDDKHFSVVTMACVIFCLLFGAAIIGFAHPLATMLGDNTLVPIIQVLAILPLIQCFSVAPTAAAQRGMQFQSVTIRTVASLLAGGAVGLALAALGAGVWALVWQALVQRFVASIVLWFAVPISFNLKPSWRHFRDVAQFAIPVMIARTMSWGEGQIPRLVLGVSLGASNLGIFNLGARLNDIVGQITVGPRALVARVDLRRFSANQEALAKAVRRVVQQISILCFPLCVGGAAVVPTLFKVWLDRRWLEGIVPAEMLLLMGIPYVTYFVAAAVLLAMNRQKSEAIVSTVQTLSILVAVAASARFGLTAVSVVLAVRSVLVLPLPILIMHRQCHLRLRDTIAPQVRPLIAACGMGVPVIFLRRWFNAAGLDDAISLIVLVVTGVILYAVLTVVMMPKPIIRARKRLVSSLVTGLIASLRARRILRPVGTE